MLRLVILLVAIVVVTTLSWFLIPWLTSTTAQTPQTPSQRDEFAADRSNKIPYDGKRAIGYLEEVCKIGPRISGSDGMKKQQELLRKHFEDQGAQVTLQTFEGKQLSQRSPVEMANLVVSWHPDRLQRVIICSHYDTRPLADQEEDRGRWREAFVSANDGGSGVAFLMELAHRMKDLKVQVGVDFVFFDGEEYIFDPPRDKYFFGSEHFAKEYQERKQKDRKYLAAILLDMIGGKGARFPVEPGSHIRAGLLVQQVWSIAGELGSPVFERQYGQEVLDDHIALNKVGIPAIDLIDFNYPHWHKLSDTPDKCSAETLEQVARVLMVWLQRLK